MEIFKKIDIRNLGAWFAIVAFFGMFIWICRNYFHIRYPVFFILLTLVVSVILIILFRSIYKRA